MDEPINGYKIIVPPEPTMEDLWGAYIVSGQQSVGKWLQRISQDLVEKQLAPSMLQASCVGALIALGSTLSFIKEHADPGPQRDSIEQWMTGVLRGAIRNQPTSIYPDGSTMSFPPNPEKG